MLWDYFMERLLLLLLGQIYLVYHIGFVLQRMDYIYIQFKSISHTISTITIWDDDCNLVVEQVFLYPNPSQIHPKSIPKPSQNHLKSSQNHPKSIPKPSQIIPKPSQIIPNRPTFTRFSIPSSPAVPLLHDLLIRVRRPAPVLPAVPFPSPPHSFRPWPPENGTILGDFTVGKSDYHGKVI